MITKRHKPYKKESHQQYQEQDASHHQPLPDVSPKISLKASVACNLSHTKLIKNHTIPTCSTPLVRNIFLFAINFIISASKPLKVKALRSSKAIKALAK
jgi:hypothetical protein